MCCSTDQGNYLGNDASSIYNALQVKVDRRFSHGLQFLSHYTFAHANKYDSNYYAISHPIAYGPDDQVRNHVWVTKLVYELPFGKGKTFAGNAGTAEDLIIGGWQITGTTNWSSGLPWTPSFNECGSEEDVGVCRPNQGSGSFHSGCRDRFSIQRVAIRIVQFFTPVANIVDQRRGPFADPGVGNLGNIGCDSFRGPRAFFADAALMKNFSITERVKAQFRMDVFNLFNHPVLGLQREPERNRCMYRLQPVMRPESPTSKLILRRVRRPVCVRLEFALKISF